MMKNTEIVYHTLPNGLRCVVRMEKSDVEFCGLAINVGSRDEQAGSEGLAHFVEHTIFKGTTHRRSWHIINRMESCGGELNAYTTKETTVVYSMFPSGNLTRAAELISDLVCNSVFPQVEIDREREVVADEISSYRDMPSEAVYDDFEDLIFSGSRLGHNILGDCSSLAVFTPDVCRDYIRKFYTAGNMVFFYAGPADAGTVLRIAERYYSGIGPGLGTAMNRVAPEMLGPFDREESFDNHQAHTVMGARIPDMYSGGRHAMALLVNIIGGPGMNSLLNVALRERRGLVYSVDASTSMFTDSGLFTLYFGCDGHDVKRCRRIVCNILDDLGMNRITDRRLAQAKRQYLGQVAVASDNRENSVLSMARGTLYYGKILTASELKEAVEAVSAQDLMNAAAYISSQNLSVLTFK